MQKRDDAVRRSLPDDERDEDPVGPPTQLPRRGRRVALGHADDVKREVDRHGDERGAHRAVAAHRQVPGDADAAEDQDDVDGDEGGPRVAPPEKADASFGEARVGVDPRFDHVCSISLGGTEGRGGERGRAEVRGEPEEGKGARYEDGRADFFASAIGRRGVTRGSEVTARVRYPLPNFERKYPESRAF